MLSGKDKNDGYDIVLPFHQDGVDQNQVYVQGSNTLGWNALVITKSAKEPDRIFHWFDWALNREQQKLFNYGPKELGYWQDDENGEPIPTQKFLDTPGDELTKLKLGDPALATLRISGSFHAGDQETLAYALARGWHLNVRQTAENELTLLPETSARLR